MNKQETLNAAYYKNKYFVTEKDLDVIREAGEVMIMEIQDVFEEFYAWFESSADFQPYLNAGSLEQLKTSHWQHWAAFFQGDIDETYIEGRKESGQLYANIGLPLELYYSSIIAFCNFFEKAFLRVELNSFEILSAFNRLTNMDTAIAMDTYNLMVTKTIKEQNDALMELSTPVTKLWDGILLLPLVGFIDSRRAQDIMTTMLDMIAETQAKIFILDISGVAVVDTAVANYLIKMTKATKLMGCTCMISGISGTVAQTIVELGVQIEEVATTGTMQDALKSAFNRTGIKIIKEEDALMS